MAEPLLSTRGLNRALLARQHLLDRSPLGIVDVVEGMGGIQTQYAPAGYIGLWSRMRDFTRPMLTQALERREIIQATLMRATIHMVSAADYWPMEVGVRRIRAEWFEKIAAREIEKFDVGAVADAVRDVLADGPLRMKELTERLGARGFPPTAARWAGTWVDLVRVPPSGTWERRRADLYGLADAWLPTTAVTEEEGMELLIRRYLGAFGPAPLKDIASWMGMKVGQMRRRGRQAGAAVTPRRKRRDPARPARRPVAGSRDTRATALPGGVGCRPAGPRSPHADPAGGAPAPDLQHEDAALAQHLPARRAGRRDLAPRRRRDQPHPTSAADSLRSERRSMTRRIGWRPSTRIDHALASAP